MKIVIDIPEQMYLNSKKDMLCGADILVSAIKNGTPYETVTEFADRCRECGREKVLDKIRAEIVDTLYVDSLIFGELIDFRNGKISEDDVIEEFNRVTRLEVLQIIDKYKAESEGE